MDKKEKTLLTICLCGIVVASVFFSGCIGGGEEGENKPPTVNAGVDQTVNAGDTVSFTGTASDPDGSITYYEWDFDGDGVYDWSSMTKGSTTHVYNNAGTYTARFRVTDNDGATAKDAITIIVSANISPIALISASPTSGYAPLTVTFSMNASDSDGSISSWELDVDNDGTAEYSGSGRPPSTKTYNYQNSGTYTAKLTVKDNEEATTYDTVIIIVFAPVPVKILTHSSYYSSGYFRVVGEVHNTGNNNIKSVMIVATFYSSNDEVVGTDFTYTDIDILIPNQKSPFELSSYPLQIIVDHYELSVQYRVTSESPYRDIEILSHSSYVDHDYFKVIGEVQNTGIYTLKSVMIVVTFYNTSGTVVGKDFTYTYLDELSPSQKSPFEASSYPRKVSEMSVAYYTIQVQARIK